MDKTFGRVTLNCALLITGIYLAGLHLLEVFTGGALSQVTIIFGVQKS